MSSNIQPIVQGGTLGAWSDAFDYWFPEGATQSYPAGAPLKFSSGTVVVVSSVTAPAIVGIAANKATGYDNATLYNTAHVDLDGTTQANRPSPDVTLSQTAIQAGQVNFDLLNDERSRPEGMAAARVMIHPANRYVARVLFGSNGQSGTANNDTNSIIEDDLSWGVVRYMIRTQDWTLSAPMMESDVEFMWRDRPRARTFDDPFIEAADHTVYQRFAMRIGDWRWTYGSSVGF